MSISLTCLPSAPSAPLNLTFPPGGVLNDSIILTWLPPQHPNGVVLLYQVQSLFVGVEEPVLINTLINTTGAGTFIVLSNLTPGTQYNFSVRAFTVAFGPFSAPLILHTADGEDTCSTVCERRACPPPSQRLNGGSQPHCFSIVPFTPVQCPQCHKESVLPALVPPLCR